MGDSQNPSQHKGASHPVENVSYDDICNSTGSFLNLLRTLTGLIFDLPTEAQWEYACRAGANGPVICMISTDTNKNGGSQQMGHKPIGSYAPNVWGVYYMLGNVAEWCLDWHGEYASNAKRIPSDLWKVIDAS